MEEKEITLSKSNEYTIGLRPSFRGSQAAVYLGDCAEFEFENESAEITYIGDVESQPKYDFIIKTDEDFDLTVTVDGYTQTIRINVE